MSKRSGPASARRRSNTGSTRVRRLKASPPDPARRVSAFRARSRASIGIGCGLGEDVVTWCCAEGARDVADDAASFGAQHRERAVRIDAKAVEFQRFGLVPEFFEAAFKPPELREPSANEALRRVVRSD